LSHFFIFSPIRSSTKGARNIVTVFLNATPNRDNHPPKKKNRKIVNHHKNNKLSKTQNKNQNQKKLISRNAHTCVVSTCYQKKSPKIPKASHINISLLLSGALAVGRMKSFLKTSSPSINDVVLDFKCKAGKCEINYMRICNSCQITYYLVLSSCLTSSRPESPLLYLPVKLGLPQVQKMVREKIRENSWQTDILKKSQGN